MSYDPSQRSLPDMERDLLALCQNMEKLGLEWADADAILQQLEDLKKVVVSDSMPETGSVSYRETEALKSVAYKNHLAGLKEARLQANQAKVRYVAAQAKLDAVRTILSNKRAMLTRGIE